MGRKMNDNYKKVFWSFFSVLLAGLTIWAVFKSSKGVSIHSLISAALSAKKGWFIAAMVSAFLFVWFEGVAIRSILKYAGYRKGPFQGLIYSTSDIYFSAITPSATGGQPASAYFMMKDGIPAGVVTAVLILNLMMYTASIIVLGFLALILDHRVILEFNPMSRLLIIAGFIALSVLTLIFFTILKKGESFFDAIGKLLKKMADKKIIKGYEKKKEKLDKIRNDYSECSNVIAGKKRILFRALAWNFLQRSSQIIVPMLLYLALGGPGSNAVKIFATQCVITIGFNFVPIPGAMGIADYLMVDGFKGLMGRDDAFQLEMLSRGITFYICVTISGIITLIGYIVRRKKSN